jgi:uncharacterized protein YecE (DUF72 family)
VYFNRPLSFRHANYLIYDLCRNSKNYNDFKKRINLLIGDKGAKYLIIDNNIEFFKPKNVNFLHKYTKNLSPPAIFKNDFGEDYHTCMDAFGRSPVHSIISD